MHAICAQHLHELRPADSVQVLSSARRGDRIVAGFVANLLHARIERHASPAMLSGAGVGRVSDDRVGPRVRPGRALLLGVLAALLAGADPVRLRPGARRLAG